MVGWKTGPGTIRVPQKIAFGDEALRYVTVDSLFLVGIANAAEGGGTVYPMGVEMVIPLPDHENQLRKVLSE